MSIFEKNRLEKSKICISIRLQKLTISAKNLLPWDWKLLVLRRIAVPSVTGPRIELELVLVQEALFLLYHDHQLPLHRVSPIRTFLILGNALPWGETGFIVTNAVNGGNTRAMSVGCLKPRLTPFAVKIHEILQLLDCRMASTIILCTPSTSLPEVGGTRVHLQRVPHLLPLMELFQKTRFSKEVTAASPLTSWN